MNYTMNLWQPYMYAATFLAQAAVAAVSALVLLGVRLPMPTTAEMARGAAHSGSLHGSHVSSQRRSAARLRTC